jgi:hypothetical protein
MIILLNYFFLDNIDIKQNNATFFIKKVFIYTIILDFLSRKILFYAYIFNEYNNKIKIITDTFDIDRSTIFR